MPTAAIPLRERLDPSLILVLLGLAAGCTFVAGPDEFPQAPHGSLNAACTNAGLCDPGLRCEGGTCLASEGASEGEGEGGISSRIACPPAVAWAGADHVWLATSEGLRARAQADLAARDELTRVALPAGASWLRLMPHGFGAVALAGSALHVVDLGRDLRLSGEGVPLADDAQPVGLAVAPDSGWAAVAWDGVLSDQLAVVDLGAPALAHRSSSPNGPPPEWPSLGTAPSGSPRASRAAWTPMSAPPSS